MSLSGRGWPVTNGSRLIVPFLCPRRTSSHKTGPLTASSLQRWRERRFERLLASLGFEARGFALRSYSRCQPIEDRESCVQAEPPGHLIFTIVATRRRKWNYGSFVRGLNTHGYHRWVATRPRRELAARGACRHAPDGAHHRVSYASGSARRTYRGIPPLSQYSPAPSPSPAAARGTCRRRPASSGAGRIHRQLVDVRGELVRAVEHLVVGDDLAGVGGHAAHRGHQAGLGAALDFVVRLVLADGVDQVVPFELVGVRLRLRERPERWSSLVEVLALVDAAAGRRVAACRR